MKDLQGHIYLLCWIPTALPKSMVIYSVYYRFYLSLVGSISSPRKKSKLNNGTTCVHQPKNTVAILNELRQGLIYKLEAQTGPIHAPVFTMTVEVCYYYVFCVLSFRRMPC